MKNPRVVVSPDQVAANISTYTRSVGVDPALAARLSMHPSWYAVRNEAGHWIFGPSKFVGYQNMTPTNYLAGYDRKDGRESEPALKRWFTQVEPNTALGIELREAFGAFSSSLGKMPNARWRVSVLQQELVARGRPTAVSDAGLSPRIDFHPDICGGRPRIRGTRIRVSDIVAALAAGDTIADLLEDFPELEEADIYAALDYAANAVDHRVFKAA